MKLGRKINMIETQEWDDLVSKTYNRPYCFQQQDGCKDRGVFELSIPSKYTEEATLKKDIPEVINGNQMCVQFDSWLTRDPKQPVNGDDTGWQIELFWHRNFYPSIYTVANDLYKKGLIDAGDYTINIDW